MNYIVLRSFIKKFDSYHKQEQEIINRTIEDIKQYLETNQASHGLRIRRLFEKIYEGRVDIHLRIAFFRDKDVVKFFCLGSHDDIRRCLKSFK